MELRQLEIFARVAALKSITRASEELFLTQPAVSRSVSALERELGTRLFDRFPRSVELTPAGGELLGHAQRILQGSEEAVRAVAEVTTGEAGRLAIGASSTAATYVLPEIFAQFRQAHPNVAIRVQTGGSALVTEMVLRNEVDLGVVMGFVPNNYLVEMHLDEFETVVVAGHGNLLSRRHSVTVNELAEQPLIVMQVGTNLRQYVDNLYRACDLQPRISMEMDNVEAIKKMVEAGLGIALLPRLAVDHEVKARSLRAISLKDNPIPARRISAILRKDRFVFASQRNFVELLTAELGRQSD